MTMTNTNKWWVLIGTGIAAIIVGIDFTVVNTSLANIQHDLNMGISQLQWIMAGFGITFCALLVAMGRLGDITGRRKILYFGIIGFGLALLGAGFSTTPHFLIAMRVLQGVCGAAIFPCGMAITANAFPQEEQGRALGIYGSIVGIGLAFGPVLGSIIVTLLNWRWIFFINIPVVIVSLLICFVNVQESKMSDHASVDWSGAGLVIIFLGALSFAINEGSNFGWFSPVIIIAMLIAIVGFIGLIFVEKDPACH